MTIRLFGNMELDDLNGRFQDRGKLLHPTPVNGLVGTFLPGQYRRKIVLFLDSVMPCFVALIACCLSSHYQNSLSDWFCQESRWVQLKIFIFKAPLSCNLVNSGNLLGGGVFRKIIDKIDKDDFKKDSANTCFLLSPYSFLLARIWYNHLMTLRIMLTWHGLRRLDGAWAFVYTCTSPEIPLLDFLYHKINESGSCYLQLNVTLMISSKHTKDSLYVLF